MIVITIAIVITTMINCILYFELFLRGTEQGQVKREGSHVLGGAVKGGCQTVIAQGGGRLSRGVPRVQPLPHKVHHLHMDQPRR